MSLSFARTQALLLLGTAAIATVVIWQLPFGHHILYPFTILSVWFHEMGHGLTAMLLGGSFQSLQLYPNGSGLATYGGEIFGGRVGRALVAAGGLLGPAIAGSILIVMARWPQWCRWSLGGIAVALLMSLLWMRTPFEFIAILGWAGAIGAIGLRGPQWLQEFTVPFLGVQACASTFSQLNYLFTKAVLIDGQYLLSDTGQIARELFLPFWFWGGLLSLTSVGLLIGSLLLTYAED